MKYSKEDITLLHQENRRWPATLTQVPVDQWQRTASAMKERNMEPPDDVWRSKTFLLQKYGDPLGVKPLRLTFSRTSMDRNGNYEQNITWDELMELKRQAGYGHRLAIEFYPPDADIVNVANMRHLFIIPLGSTELPQHWVKGA